MASSATETILLKVHHFNTNKPDSADHTYATKVFPFTESIKEMQSNVQTMSAQGGGDGPESVACALHDALEMDYRKNSARVVIIISDAPPHGIKENGDGFPEGVEFGSMSFSPISRLSVQTRSLASRKKNGR